MKTYHFRTTIAVLANSYEEAQHLLLNNVKSKLPEEQSGLTGMAILGVKIT